MMKISLWLSSSVSEIQYVKKESHKSHGPYIENPYEDKDEENE